MEMRRERPRTATGSASAVLRRDKTVAPPKKINPKFFRKGAVFPKYFRNISDDPKLFDLV
jgi:hypothetical protein